uniref:Ribosomal protein L10 n=2 Tax=Ginkgo biloba TaxID=3311 RepID=A0A8F4MGH6_GINBI|nr:ribosomal protein L10 [Ginkgo biloba]
MPFGRSLLQSKTRDIEKISPEIIISFHSSGSTSNQWRKPKNPWFPGRTPFRPSCRTDDGELMDRKEKQGWFSAQLAHSAGPTCISYLTEKAPGNIWSEFLPSRDSVNRNIISSYGQYQSTLVDHMDVEKASDSENESELETSLFHFHLPSSYPCFVCSPI